MGSSNCEKPCLLCGLLDHIPNSPGSDSFIRCIHCTNPRHPRVCKARNACNEFVALAKCTELQQWMRNLRALPRSPTDIANCCEMLIVIVRSVMSRSMPPLSEDESTPVRWLFR